MKWGTWVCSLVLAGRSPSRGAWIEIAYSRSGLFHRAGRSPSRGAWIEIESCLLPSCLYLVAPPRGERGLKYEGLIKQLSDGSVAPPRGERGLKSYYKVLMRNGTKVAPPRGERGLKYLYTAKTPFAATVAPPRGERGLKYELGCGRVDYA